MTDFKRFAVARKGATAIEYAMIVAAIAAAAVFSIQVLGIDLAATFWTLANTIGAALGG